MEHKHEPILQLDGRILCRTCGELLPSMEEKGTIVSSRVRAIGILTELAIAGHYQASYSEDGFPVYGRTMPDGSREEVTAKQNNKRSFRVFRRIISA